LKIDDTASSSTTNSYNVPVDSQMSEISISIRGSGVTSSLTKPDGSTLDLTSAGVSSTVLSDGQFITVKSPAVGTWTVSIVGDAKMEPGSGEEGEAPANSFYGEMRLSPGTLYAYCSGVDAAGAPFQRVLASVFTPVLSNSTDSGFNDTDPFAVLSSLTNSST